MSRRVSTTVLRGIILVHRWMGVFFCLLFVSWFVSGMVMMYWSFPQVEAEQRLSHAPPIDPSKILVPPGQAFAALHAPGSPTQVRLNVLDGRPVYRFAFGRRTGVVFADDGARFESVSSEAALRIASSWTGLPSTAASFHGSITRDDQWTIYSSVRPYGPFWKYSWPGGEEVYVSQATGEVVQHTTRGSRWGAYLGAIPHWLYFTPLRRNSALWNQVVIWLSGAGAVSSLLGLVAGVWVWSPARRRSIPYTGARRWHVILGLIFGLFTCTWAFSGLLSMGPFSWLTDRDRPNVLGRSRLDLGRFSRPPGEAIAAAGLSVRELEFTSFAGEPLYLALETPRQTRLVPMQGESLEMLETERILQVVRRSASPAAVAGFRLVGKYEPYYTDRRHRRPLPALYVELNDAGRSAYYIDPRTGRLVQSYGARARWNRWLYHGLHSLDFPWLYERRPAWDIVVLFLMLGGTALSVTSLIIGWRVVCKFKSTVPAAPAAIGLDK